MSGPSIYMVWSPAGEAAPKVQHRTHKAAFRAVHRMARSHPGSQFYVVKTVGAPVSTDAHAEPPVTGCAGKVLHLTHDAAMRQIANLQRMGKISTKAGRRDMIAYHCDHCRFWHVGSSQA